MKKGNHWSIIQVPKDKIRHKDAKKYAALEMKKIRKEAHESAKNFKEER